MALRWSVQGGAVPLPKSVTPKRLEENIAIVRTTAGGAGPCVVLDDEDMASIARLDKGFRLSRGEGLCVAGMTWQQVWEGEGGNGEREIDSRGLCTSTPFSLY